MAYLPSSFGGAENRFPGFRGGGKSEHHRARCRVTRPEPGYTREATSRGVPTESATENKPPEPFKYGAGKGEKVG